MKIALISDTHFGARNDCQIFARYIDKFYNEHFFPYLEKHGINNVIHLGDIMDRRKYVNYLTANQIRNVFLKRLHDEQINTHFIIGNHDTFYKNSNDINSMSELCQAYRKYISWSSETEHVLIGKTPILLVPWINSNNYERTMNIIQTSPAEVCVGHLELKGFGMYKGVINEHGMDSSIFNKFRIVCSGHFHHKSTKGNVTYLGAPYQITWSDFDDSRGFHVFDTDDYSLQYVVNPLELFGKIIYDDSNISINDINDMDFSSLKGKYIKVIEREKNNPYLFDKVIEKIEAAEVADLQVVNDHKHQDILKEEDVVDETTDTLSVINYIIENKNENFDVVQIKSIVQELYNEAIQR